MILHGSAYFVLVTLSSVTYSLSISCDSFESGTENKPKILVSSTPGQLRLEDDNETTTYTVASVGIEIRIDCWAPYPIDVRFMGPLSNREHTVGSIQRTARDHQDPTTFCFGINITVKAYEQTTGDFACFAVANSSELRSSVYIYHTAHPPETLLNRGQALFVEMKRDEAWLTFPCASSNPHVPVHLYQRNGTEEVRLLVDGKYLKYSPKTGFSIWSPLINPSVSISLFQCRTDSTPHDRVDIAVLPPRDPIVTPTEPVLLLKDGDRLRVTCESTQDLTITNSNPEVQGVTAGNPKSEGFLPYLFTYQSWSLRGGDSGRVSCRSKATNVTLHEWTYNVLESQENRTSEDEKVHNVLQGLNPYACKVPGRPTQLALHSCNSWVECNLRKCHVQDRTCESNECKNSQTSSCVPNGIIQCFNAYNQSVQAQIYFSGLHNRNRTYTYWKAAPMEDILKIRKIRKEQQGQLIREVNGTLENVELICEGSSFVFAVGFKWFVLDELEKAPVEIDQGLVQHKWRRLTTKNIIRSSIRVRIPVNAKAVICKAPVWNTTEWAETSVSVSSIFDDFKLSHAQNASQTPESSSASTFQSWSSGLVMSLLLATKLYILIKLFHI